MPLGLGVEAREFAVRYDAPYTVPGAGNAELERTTDRDGQASKFEERDSARGRRRVREVRVHGSQREHDVQPEHIVADACREHVLVVLFTRM